MNPLQTARDYSGSRAGPACSSLLSECSIMKLLHLVNINNPPEPYHYGLSFVNFLVSLEVAQSPVQAFTTHQVRAGWPGSLVSNIFISVVLNVLFVHAIKPTEKLDK